MSEKAKGRGRSSADDETDRRLLGTKLRDAREYLGLSQNEVSKYLEIPRTALSHIESGQRRVDALELKKLATLYKRPVSFFTGEAPADESLPQDVAHLARAAAGLSESDRKELGRFAEYLRSRSESETSDG